jgi:hypothetical protein
MGFQSGISGKFPQIEFHDVIVRRRGLGTGFVDHRSQ